MIEDTPEIKPKSLTEQLEERIHQLDTQKKQTEMGYAEILGAISEARRILAMLNAEVTHNQ